MMPRSLWLASLASVSLLAAARPALAVDVTEISVDDYYGAAYFKTAVEHPDVAKQKSEPKQIAAVAKDMGWTPAKLSAAVEKVRGLEGDPLELAKAAMMAAFDASRVKGQVLDVLFNASEPKHVVCYVRWRGSKGKDATREASTIASIVVAKAPFVSTLSLAAIHPSAADDNKDSVWQGKIARTAMARINAGRIDAYADTLYKRMFEEVKEIPF